MEQSRNDAVERECFGARVAVERQLPIPPREIALSTLTAPLVVEGVTTSQGRRTLVFVVGSDDTVFAIDADSGKVVWQKASRTRSRPPDRHMALLQYPERNPGHRQAERDHLSQHE